MLDLYLLLSHLKNCPEVFFEKSQFHQGSIHTEALIADCFRLVSGNLLLDSSAIPDRDEVSRLGERSLTAIHISCWFFSHRAFSRQPRLLAGIRNFMFHRLTELASYVDARQWVEDEDRNEEFVRVALDCCELVPDGESEIEAADRLDALSTVKRQAVLKESSEAFERMMEIRRKMAEQKAREAANVYGRE